MCVEEDTLSTIDEARNKGYAWIPSALSDLEVESQKKFCFLDMLIKLQCNTFSFNKQCDTIIGNYVDPDDSQNVVQDVQQ